MVPDVSFAPVNEQMDEIRRDTLEIVPEDELARKLERSLKSGKPLVIKQGFDPTRPDLHIGHAVSLRKLRTFQELGHDVVFVMGDYTALIGDPSGRSDLRPQLSEEEVRENGRTYAEQVYKVLDREHTELRFNSEWFGPMSAADMIRLAARHTVARMLERDDFEKRYRKGEPIGIHEFLYPLIQGYDSVVMRSDVELGGHDQIFNLNVGRHLMARYELAPQIVMTVGLLLGLDGVEKMSKSKGNAIGITEAPRDMFGKVMSISDTLMADWYPPLLGAAADTSDPNRSKQALAEQIVARFHGATAAAEVLAWWRAGRPVDEVHEQRATSGPIYQVVRDVGAATSGGDARRKIEQGGVRLGGVRVGDPMAVVAPGRYELEVGKKFKVRLLVE